MSLAVGVSGAAQAAPQALALVETQGKINLACIGATCSAELTSFCLDSSRFSPRKGTEYTLATAGLVQLTGTTAAGRKIMLDAAKVARFTSARRHLAVRLSVDRAKLRTFGLDHISVEVAADAALLPVPTRNDPTAISEVEAQLLTGPLRKLGSRIVDHNSTRMQAARITSRMINLLPPNAGTGGKNVEPVWRRATAAATPQGKALSPKARKQARGALELCRFVSRMNSSISLKRCLQEKHDGLVDFLNSEYWKAVKTGT
ncbi:MAG: hypothetical protein HKN05_21975 [Rhizobiales bacterium]|nr:hypothetical protein [Hyphomicrobiales bacterium]